MHDEYGKEREIIIKKNLQIPLSLFSVDHILLSMGFEWSVYPVRLCWYAG